MPHRNGIRRETQVLLLYNITTVYEKNEKKKFVIFRIAIVGGWGVEDSEKKTNQNDKYRKTRKTTHCKPTHNQTSFLTIYDNESFFIIILYI